MEQIIDKRIAPAILLIVGMWVCGAVIYSLGDCISFGSDRFWWAFDKLNDRMLIIGLLSIVSFRFNILAVRLFCYASIVYTVFRAYLELFYIFEGADTKGALWAISGVYALFIILSLIILLYVGSRRNF